MAKKTEVSEKELHDIHPLALEPHRADTYMKDAARRAGKPELADAPGENGLDNEGASNVHGSAVVLDHPEFSPHPDVRKNTLSKDDLDAEVAKAASES